LEELPERVLAAPRTNAENMNPAEPQIDGSAARATVAEIGRATGLGKVAAGEGTLGLQRAFQVAGVRSVVASLWSVDDKSTRSLVERFYENIWQKKMSRQEALRQAQLAMLRGELERGFKRLDDEPADRRFPPYYWAAFVLSGDWR